MRLHGSAVCVKSTQINEAIHTRRVNQWKLESGGKQRSLPPGFYLPGSVDFC